MPPSSLPWMLTSPASRGIGLAFAQQLLATSKAPLVATARSKPEECRSRILEGAEEWSKKMVREKQEGEGRDDEESVMSDAEERLTVVELDVTDESSISAAAHRCKTLFPPTTHHLSLAMLSPGILYPEKSPSQIDASHALETLKVNLLGPMLLAKHFSPFLPKKSTPLPSSATATIAFLAARVGSISDNRLGGWYSYRTSKSGVIQLAKTLDLYLQTLSGDKAVALALHPGTVKTELSREFWGRVSREANGGHGIFEADESAERLLGVIRAKDTKTMRGRCWDWAGKEVLP